MMTTMERIKQQRKILGVSQEELSRRAGVSLKTVQRWENGERSPNTLVMPKIAEALNTTVGYLMGIEDNATNEQPQQLDSVKNPTMAYWGGVLDNAKLAIKSGKNLGLIYSLLSDAAGEVKAAMA